MSLAECLSGLATGHGEDQTLMIEGPTESLSNGAPSGCHLVAIANGSKRGQQSFRRPSHTLLSWLTDFGP